MHAETAVLTIQGQPAAGGAESVADAPLSVLLAGLPDVLSGLHVVFESSRVFGTTPEAAIGVVTDAGRAALARIPVDGLRFNTFEFQIGRGGYDAEDPMIVVTPDPSDTALLDPIWPAADEYAPVTRIDRPTIGGVAFLCRVEADEALVGIGEIGVFATITASPSNPGEVGDRFLFAIAHRPLLGKAPSDSVGFYVTILPT